jgi:RHS repeat-associated protein
VSSTTTVDPYGTGWNATTEYTWDDRWYLPRTARTFADSAAVRRQIGGTAHTEYDPATGNPLWQRTGDDDARRVRYRYHPAGHPHAGQLRAVESPTAAAGTAVDSLVYDGVGNLSITVSPLGFLTLHHRDELGRDTLVITPIDSATARAPLSVARFATPDYGGGGMLTEYGYDPAGRMLRDSSTQAGVQRFQRDQAGNVTVARTARGAEVRMRYDALGRLTRRMVPERTYARECDDVLLNFETCEWFPRFPNYGTGYRVPEEWHHYRYDADGQQAYAENADAIVTRTYTPGGALRTDSTWIRAAEGATYAAYGLRYTYDPAGRITALEHPRNLTATVRPDSFSYHPVTGALTRAVSRLGHGFDFHHAHDGALTSIRMPGAVVDSMRYDREGRLTWRLEAGPQDSVLHAETMQYDARGKLLHVVDGGSAFRNWYSGLGTLVGNDWHNLQDVGRIAEELRTDPLGNIAVRRTTVGADANAGEFPQFQNVYQASTGRLIAMRRVPPANPGAEFAQDSTRRFFDAGGNVTRTYQRVARPASDGGVEPGREVETRSYYGADDRLRVFQKMELRRTTFSNHEDAGVWEEYRYDPLGRRVMVRTRTDGGLCNHDAWGCTSSTTTFVWAGDQLLWELKSASGTYAAAAGGDVSYFHAGGIDRPLVITKSGESIVPHQNWRGVFARGTYADGPRVGRSSDCPPGVTTGCTPIQWPGERTTAYHELDPRGEIRNWFGGLVDDMRDASGQMYRRNRYYDPQTGQFTQPDPIGLAGGANAYGFADGDPVSYGDPYGTCAWGIGRDAALGRCSDTDVQHAPAPQDECRRDGDGACVTYIPSGEWDAVGRQIRRFPNTPGKCGWIRTELLGMWRRGAEAGHFRFWNGRDVLSRNQRAQPVTWRVGQYIHDPRGSWFEFERRVFFSSRVALPHEGLHMYYHHFPEPEVNPLVLHARIYEEQQQCRLR